MARELREPIARSTDTRADKRLERVFVDLSGKIAVLSIEENGTHLLHGMISHGSHKCTF